MASKGYRYENTRQWVRLPCNWYVKYKIAGRKTPETLVIAKDVSAGGIRLETQEPVELGTQVTLKVNANVAPIREVLEITGKVVRVREISPEVYEWGIEFEDIGKEKQAELNKRIELLAGGDRVGRHKGQWWRQV